MKWLFLISLLCVIVISFQFSEILLISKQTVVRYQKKRVTILAHKMYQCLNRQYVVKREQNVACSPDWQIVLVDIVKLAVNSADDMISIVENLDALDDVLAHECTQNNKHASK